MDDKVVEIPVPIKLLLGLDTQAINGILEDVATAARASWVNEANKVLHSSRDTYVNAIQEVEMGDGSATISLLGTVANIVEWGGDLHNVLLGPQVPISNVGSPGKHVSKKGYDFRAIPFRKLSPTGGGQGRGTQKVSENTKRMPAEVYAAAKQLAPSKVYGGHTQWGEHLPSGIMREQYPGQTISKHDEWSGMVKFEHEYSRKKGVNEFGQSFDLPLKQTYYGTFRTISEAKPEGWVVEAHHVMDNVADKVEELAIKAFEQYVDGIIKESK